MSNPGVGHTAVTVAKVEEIKGQYGAIHTAPVMERSKKESHRLQICCRQPYLALTRG